MAIFNQGVLLFQGPWGELGSEKLRYRLELDDWTRAEPIFAGLGARRQGREEIELPDGADVAELVAALVAAGVRIRALEPQRRSLETLYLEAVSGGPETTIKPTI